MLHEGKKTTQEEGEVPESKGPLHNLILDPIKNLFNGEELYLQCLHFPSCLSQKKKRNNSSVDENCKIQESGGCGPHGGKGAKNG